MRTTMIIRHASFGHSKMADRNQKSAVPDDVKSSWSSAPASGLNTKFRKELEAWARDDESLHSAVQDFYGSFK